MISMAEARRYVENISNIPTEKLLSVLRILQELKLSDCLTREQEWLMPHVEAELKRRHEDTLQN